MIPLARMSVTLLLDKADWDDVSVGGIPKGFEHRLSERYEVIKRE